MQSLRLNPVLSTDSYKLTHWRQYPPDTHHIYLYLESRGGMFEETMLAMLQYIIKSNFAGQRFVNSSIGQIIRTSGSACGRYYCSRLFAKCMFSSKFDSKGRGFQGKH
jgi:hypothetical protein